MRTKIRIFILVILVFCNLVFSMEEIVEHESLSHLDNPPMLEPELQLTILFYWLENETIATISAFDKCNLSYQKLKSLSLVNKSFKPLEHIFIKKYKKWLIKLFNNSLDENDVCMFYHIVITPNLLDQEEKITDHYYQELINWLGLKNPKITISALIILRLQNLTQGQEEQFIMHDIWSKLEQNGSLLHNACRNGNMELAEYLLKSKLANYFAIDVNKLNKEGYTPLMMACNCIRNKRNLKIIQLLLNAGANVSITVLKKRPVKWLMPENQINGKNGQLRAEYSFRKDTALDLAKNNNYHEAYNLIKQYLLTKEDCLPV